MMKGFRNNSIQSFYVTRSKAGIQAKHADRLSIMLGVQGAACSHDDMSEPGWKLHKLAGKNPKGQSVKDHWSVSVSGNWRLTFYFDGEHAVLVDYQDYH